MQIGKNETDNIKKCKQKMAQASQKRQVKTCKLLEKSLSNALCKDDGCAIK